MFSQLRNAVENLAHVPIPQPRRGSDATDGRESMSRSASLDLNPNRQPSSPLSSSQLADSAIANLRKSFASNRSASPASTSRRPTVPHSQSDKDVRKMNLEERLRANFTIGDVSTGTTPAASSRASPKPETPARVTSPSSVPLPDTPPMSPLVAASNPPPIAEEIPKSPEPASSLEGDTAPEPSLNVSEKSERHPEAEIPLPEDEAVESTPAADDTDSEKPDHPLGDVADSAAVPDGTERPDEATQVDVSSPKNTVPETENNSDEVPPTENSTQPPADSDNVDALQERLRLLEQRFSEVTDSIKRLQAERDLTDKVVREATPLKSSQNSDELRDYLQNVQQKLEMSEDDVQRLNNKLTRQEDRIEELRDIHRLESSSQSDQVEQLRKQLSETEALFKTTQEAVSQAKSESARFKSEVDKLKGDVERNATIAKEEEEKRVKAISLLKTVRQKLVKAEKDKEEALKEAAAAKDREQTDRGKVQAETSKLQKEIDAVNAEREQAVNGLKAQFDKEISALKDRHEKEVAALRGQFELDAITVKSVHSKEIATKESQISALENSVNSLSRDKNNFFDQLQMRQAEVESVQSHLESLQSQNTELQYQLRETNDRLALLSENLSEARREQEGRSLTPMTSTDDVARLIASTEAKYESKLADLRRDLSSAERERNESESEWSRKLREKSREAEELRMVLQSSAKTREDITETVNGLNSQIEALKHEIGDYRVKVASLQLRGSKIDELEAALKDSMTESELKVSVLENQLEESKAREAQIRANNKTLREELRKVQSSVALLERQRNPGVGYWTTRTDQPPTPTQGESRTSLSSSSSDLTSRIASPPPPSSPRPQKDDEEVNLEYLRNVILQFLEHKEMRPSLVKVLSIILHFTPQETRRLIARV
ncbi:hypothetical protein HGRIS_007829 [Hohenbuehelia grisea]|uniref:GRIP domain-containing protein n=1 Tax=Hohenbuehelia grisea TaxID=104357 RepID=A0ABR3J617_9AGAR